MITLEVLNLYNKYEGNGDLFVRLGSEEEKDVLDYDSWVLIEEFIRNFHLIRNIHPCRDLTASFKSKLSEHCENLDVIHQIQGLAAKENFM